MLGSSFKRERFHSIFLTNWVHFRCRDLQNFAAITMTGRGPSNHPQETDLLKAKEREVRLCIYVCVCVIKMMQKVNKRVSFVNTPSNDCIFLFPPAGRNASSNGIASSTVASRKCYVSTTAVLYISQLL